jgi:hypothetical protein
LKAPALTAFSAASMVGSMFHSALATTVSGYWAWVSITLPMASTLRSLAASLTPKRSAYITSAPLSIIAKAASLAFGGSNQLLMKLTVKLTLGLVSFAPAMKAFISRLTSGMG